MVHHSNQENTLVEFQGNYKLLDHLLKLQESGKLDEILGVSVINIDAKPITTENSNKFTLSQWFQGTFTQGWQTVEELLNPQQLIPATWNEPIKRAKLISELPQPVVLVITLRERQTSPQVNVGIEVYPKDQATLPLNFTLQMLVEDRVLSQAIATSNSPYLECRFNCDYEDKFTIKLIDSGVELEENFIV
jgi:hypothetical protein